MRFRFLLVGGVAAFGCASAPRADGAGGGTAWARGSEPQLVNEFGVGFGQQGHLRFVSRSPLYVVFLELRPSRDSVDLNPGTDRNVTDALTATTELTTAMETVDALTPATASAQYTNCTTVKMGAGDPTGTQVCPVSRSYGAGTGRTWRFRNRVFLLVSDRPFAIPLPGSIPWAGSRTNPPVAAGSRWTAIEL